MATPLTIQNVTVAQLTGTPANTTARREHCAVTADVAAALGIPTSPFARRPLRVVVTTPATTPTGVSSANLVAVQILAGTNTLSVYPNSSSTANNGGIFKLFEANSIPTGARVTLRNLAPSATTKDGVLDQHFTEPNNASQKSFVEFATTGTGRLMVLAPHGGIIEKETSTQLAAMKVELALSSITPASWDCQGKWGNDQTHLRWHVNSDDIMREAFPGLAHLMTTYPSFPFAVALHGFSWDETSTTQRRGIVIGGRAASTLKVAIMNQIKLAVDAALGSASNISFYIADPAGDQIFDVGTPKLSEYSGIQGLRGVATANIVNRLAPTGGVHIEQSRGIRENATIAPAVAKGIAKALAAVVPAASAVEEPVLAMA